MEQPIFETWAFVELYGHRQLAGKVTEQQVAGSTFLRVDVPEQDEHPPITRLYGANAIYSITPCTEEVAKAALRRLRPDPLPFYVPELIPQVPAITAGEERGDDWDHDGGVVF